MIRPGNPTPEVSGRGQPRPDVEEARRRRADERARGVEGRGTRSSAQGARRKTDRQARPPPSARTLVEGNPSLALVIPGLRPAPAEPLVPLRHSVGPEGDLFLLFPRASPAVRAVLKASAAFDTGEAEGVLEVTDVAPVAVPHRIRARAQVAGRLTPCPGAAFEAGTELLRLEPGEITLDDLWGTCLVEPDAFAAAAADPLRVCETEVLQHLAAWHSSEVALLCGLVESSPATGGCSRTATGAVPLALDRFGLRVRFTGDGGSFDARFDFPEPVSGPDDARRALRSLFAAARQD